MALLAAAFVCGNSQRLLVSSMGGLIVSVGKYMHSPTLGRNWIRTHTGTNKKPTLFAVYLSEKTEQDVTDDRGNRGNSEIGNGENVFDCPG